MADCPVPTVDIDASGTFYYVLIKLFSSTDSDKFTYIIRGHSWAGYHGNEFRQVENC